VIEEKDIYHVFNLIYTIMKWIKKYENFVNDDNRDTASLDFLPKHNPVIKQQATEYVDSVLNSNDFEDLFQLVGTAKS
jgi:hypothetical protein